MNFVGEAGEPTRRMDAPAATPASPSSRPAKSGPYGSLLRPPYSSAGVKRSSTTSVSRFFLETLVVASNDAGLAKATIDLGLSDVGRRYVGLDPSLPIVLSCAGMRWPRRPKLRSPCCAYDEGRDYWDLATLELQAFRPTRCSRAQAGRLPHHLPARHARAKWQASSTDA